MAKFKPKGVMPALVTPFTKDGDVIEEGFKDIIDYTIEKGATGLVPAGTTGELSICGPRSERNSSRCAWNSRMVACPWWLGPEKLVQKQQSR